VTVIDLESKPHNRETAESAFSRQQKRFIVAMLAFATAALIIYRLSFVTILMACVATFYTTIVLLKVYLASKSVALLRFRPSYRPFPDPMPKITVLAPLYDEAPVVRRLIQRLDLLEWPREKLEVLLLIREDDYATRAALRGLCLPASFKIFDIAAKDYGTKPAALNAALRNVHSDYFVIYDAESCPEPDQLKKLHAALRAAGSGTVAAAGVPVVSNWQGRRSTFMSRMLAAEYTAHYQLHNPALMALGWPTPLPGNSVMFRLNAIKAIGLYDRFNKTEDADIGVRINRHGGQCVYVDTQSYEQAPTSYMAWMRQRRRWIDGFMQTYLVHMRHPVRLYRDLGAIRFLVFQVIVGGGPFLLLLNPFFLLMTAAYAVTGANVIRQIQPPITYYQSMLCFVVGNSFFLFLLMLGSMRKQMWSAVPWILFSPLYWIAMSHAAVAAVYDLIFQPRTWHKTEHQDDDIDVPFLRDIRLESALSGDSTPLAEVPLLARQPH
jgi:cellulose synthase/poly-beta-1,6-N-acetylglucosamine synthase-like glycosyltransferase